MTMENKNDKTLVKLVFESYAIRNTEGKEIFRSASNNEILDEYKRLVEIYDANGITLAAERAPVDCEVVSADHVVNCRHMTLYHVYVNDEFVKELMFRPDPLAVIRAVAPGLDWKRFSN